jgi:hypothetical protein
MRSAFAQLSAIARFSVVELLGTPAVLLMMLTASMGSLVLPLFQFQRFSEDGRLARDCGLATAFLFGLFLVAGSAGRLRRALTDGTAAIALVKPLSRGVWLGGQLLGSAAMLVWFLLGMSAAVLTAEAYAPQYHTTGEYADIVGVLRSLLFPIGALLLGAANNRFRRGRFTLTASLCLTPLLWMGALLAPKWHIGILSFPPIILLFLTQILTLAGAAAMRFPIGIITSLTLGSAFLFLIMPGGAAWLPLDTLAYGGAVPFRTLCLLLPQALTTTACFLWLGMTLLYRKESV